MYAWRICILRLVSRQMSVNVFQSTCRQNWSANEEKKEAERGKENLSYMDRYNEKKEGKSRGDAQIENPSTNNFVVPQTIPTDVYSLFLSNFIHVLCNWSKLFFPFGNPRENDRRKCRKNPLPSKMDQKQNGTAFVVHSYPHLPSLHLFDPKLSPPLWIRLGVSFTRDVPQNRSNLLPLGSSN